MREPGFYWVKFNKWRIAEWTGFDWFFSGIIDPYKDHHFEYIDEKRLTHESR